MYVSSMKTVTCFSIYLYTWMDIYIYISWHSIEADGWDGMGWDGMGWDGWMDGWMDGHKPH